MSVLLDTHTLIWVALDASELSVSARWALDDEQTAQFCSLASLWEISIKVNIKKLDLTVPLAVFFSEVRKRFEVLPVEEKHCLRHATLPLHHRDPFDRMIIAQALSENLTIISNDSAFDAYGVRRIW